MEGRGISRVEMIASQIKRLTPTELAELRRLLDDPPQADPDGGVRVPRQPRPPRPQHSAALEIPESDDELENWDPGSMEFPYLFEP